MESNNKVDLLVQPIGIGDYVAYSDSNTLYIGQVTKLHKIMVTVQQLYPSSSYRVCTKRIYPTACCLVPPDRVMILLLKRGHNVS